MDTSKAINGTTNGLEIQSRAEDFHILHSFLPCGPFVVPIGHSIQLLFCVVASVLMIDLAIQPKTSQLYDSHTGVNILLSHWR